MKKTALFFAWLYALAFLVSGAQAQRSLTPICPPDVMPNDHRSRPPCTPEYQAQEAAPTTYIFSGTNCRDGVCSNKSEVECAPGMVCIEQKITDSKPIPPTYPDRYSLTRDEAHPFHSDYDPWWETVESARDHCLAKPNCTWVGAVQPPDRLEEPQPKTSGPVEPHAYHDLAQDPLSTFGVANIAICREIRHVPYTTVSGCKLRSGYNLDDLVTFLVRGLNDERVMFKPHTPVHHRSHARKVVRK